jgi:Fe-S-cluster-containing dehydrogenase component
MNRPRARRRKPASARRAQSAEIFKRKCPHCLKAVPFRASEERAGGKLRVTTVSCTSCGVVLGVLPYLGPFPDRREVETIVRGIVRRHVGSAVKKLGKQVRRAGKDRR